MATATPVLAEALVLAEARHRRQRFMRWLIVGAVLVVGGGFGLYLFTEYVAEARLAIAIADADRLDPGWRAEELLASRYIPSDEENAAVTVIKLTKSLPRNWHQSWMERPFDGPHYDHRHRLNDGDYQMLKLQLQRVAPHLELARTLASKRHGYIPVDWKIDCFSVALPYTQEARTVATLLGFDVHLLLHEGRADEALRSVEAIIGGSCAVADEPTLISSLVRMAIHATALDRLQRCLAMSEPSPAALLQMQRRLEEEEANNYVLPGLRGERAFIHRWLDHVRKDPTEREKLFKMLSTGAMFGVGPPAPRLAIGITSIDDFINRLGIRLRLRAWPEEQRQLLATGTRIVEIAKMPDAAREEAMRDFRIRYAEASLLVRTLTPAFQKIFQAQDKLKTAQRSAITALAAERFRRDHGRWPSTAEELVPKYATRVYLDAYTGKPLFWKSRPDGLVIYGVGMNRQDNQGDVLPSYPQGAFQAASDVGFVLTNPASRNQPALPSPPAATEGEARADLWIAF